MRVDELPESWQHFLRCEPADLAEKLADIPRYACIAPPDKGVYLHEAAILFGNTHHLRYLNTVIPPGKESLRRSITFAIQQNRPDALNELIRRFCPPPHINNAQVNWLLREIITADKAELLDFLSDLLSQYEPNLGIQSAIEEAFAYYVIHQKELNPSFLRFFLQRITLSRHDHITPRLNHLGFGELVAEIIGQRLALHPMYVHDSLNIALEAHYGLREPILNRLRAPEATEDTVRMILLETCDNDSPELFAMALEHPRLMEQPLEVIGEILDDIIAAIARLELSSDFDGVPRRAELTYTKYWARVKLVNTLLVWKERHPALWGERGVPFDFPLREAILIDDPACLTRFLLARAHPDREMGHALQIAATKGNLVMVDRLLQSERGNWLSRLADARGFLRDGFDEDVWEPESCVFIATLRNAIANDHPTMVAHLLRLEAIGGDEETVAFGLIEAIQSGNQTALRLILAQNTIHPTEELGPGRPALPPAFFAFFPPESPAFSRLLDELLEAALLAGNIAQIAELCAHPNLQPHITRDNLQDKLDFFLAMHGPTRLRELLADPRCEVLRPIAETTGIHVFLHELPELPLAMMETLLRHFRRAKRLSSPDDTQPENDAACTQEFVRILLAEAQKQNNLVETVRACLSNALNEDYEFLDSFIEELLRQSMPLDPALLETLCSDEAFYQTMLGAPFFLLVKETAHFYLHVHQAHREESMPHERLTFLASVFFSLLANRSAFSPIPPNELEAFFSLPQVLTFLTTRTTRLPEAVSNSLYQAYVRAVREHSPIAKTLVQFDCVLLFAQQRDIGYSKIVKPYIREKLTDLARRGDEHPRADFSLSPGEIRTYYTLLHSLIVNNQADEYPHIQRLLALPSLQGLLHHAPWEASPGTLIHAAIQAGNQGALRALLNAPTVRELCRQVAFQPPIGGGLHELRVFAQAPESSMVGLNQTEQEAIEELKARYRTRVEELGGIEGVWEALQHELEQRYEANPAFLPVEDGRIPLPYTRDDFDGLLIPGELQEAAEEAYYQHPVHTAARFLSRNNGWLSGAAQFIQYHPDSGGYGARLDNHKELICYFWLAASDEHTPCVDGHTLDSRIEFYISSLALTGRAHNWDRNRPRADGRGREAYDDLEGDKPSCNMGISRRIFQSVAGYPLLINLSDDLFLEELKDFLQAHFYSKLPDKPRALRRLLVEADRVIIDLEEPCELLRSLDLTQAEEDDFFAKMQEKYGRKFSLNPKILSLMLDEFAITAETCHFTNFFDVCALRQEVLRRIEAHVPAPAAELVRSRSALFVTGQKRARDDSAGEEASAGEEISARGATAPARYGLRRVVSAPVLEPSAQRQRMGPSRD